MLPLRALSTIRDKAARDRRRRVWDSAFSAKALRNYEARVTSYAHQLESNIAAFGTSKTGIEMSQYFHFFAFDVMSDLAFGKSFGMLKSGKTHYVVDLMLEGIAALGPLGPIHWIYPIGPLIPGALRNWNTFLAWCASQVQKRLQVRVSHSRKNGA